jgi:hypothetical protein
MRPALESDWMRPLVCMHEIRQDPRTRNAIIVDWCCKMTRMYQHAAYAHDIMALEVRPKLRVLFA